MSLAWVSVSEAAKAMGVGRTTAYRKFHRMERRVGRRILVTKRLHGKEILAVRRSDLERLIRIDGGEAESRDFEELQASLDAVVSALEDVVLELRKSRNE